MTPYEWEQYMDAFRMKQPNPYADIEARLNTVLSDLPEMRSYDTDVPELPVSTKLKNVALVGTGKALDSLNTLLSVLEPLSYPQRAVTAGLYEKYRGTGQSPMAAALEGLKGNTDIDWGDVVGMSRAPTTTWEEWAQREIPRLGMNVFLDPLLPLGLISKGKMLRPLLGGLSKTLQSIVGTKGLKSGAKIADDLGQQATKVPIPEMKPLKERTLKKIQDPSYGKPGATRARSMVGEITNSFFKGEGTIEQRLRDAGIHPYEFVEFLRRNPQKGRELLEDDISVWDVGVRVPESFSANWRDLQRWQIANSPTMSAINDALTNMVSGIQKGASKAYATAAPANVVSKLVDSLLTTDVASNYGDLLADTLGSTVKTVQDITGKKPDKLWWNKLSREQKARYKKAKNRPGPEDYDPWQRRVLQQWHRDIKPDIDPDTLELLKTLRDVAPALGGAGALMYAIPPFKPAYETKQSFWDTLSADEPAPYPHLPPPRNTWSAIVGDWLRGD